MREVYTETFYSCFKHKRPNVDKDGYIDRYLCRAKRKSYKLSKKMKKKIAYSEITPFLSG